MHIHLALVSLCLFGLSSAQQSSVTKLNLPRSIVDSQKIEASVVKADSSSTVYWLNCPKRADSSECFLPGVNLKQARNEIGLDYSAPGYEGGMMSFRLECQLQTAFIDCARLQLTSSDGKDWATVVSTDIVFPATLFASIDVTITAGLEKLKGAATATPVPTTSAESSTGTGAGAGGAGRAAPTGTSAAATAGESGGKAAPSSSQGHAAMPLATAAASWGVIGGAAMAVAALAM
ncbi:uncharacterized protein PADG_06677 [Paracoccidioides brasiliensis Pb18]|uniref:Uncharacterized protein n=2 Tax=Paracoccidioides brasiliensis TaxID=121759 RepID=C1GHE1_PARBD|nr:uncharacterized protein PADG_06677 [Paracoccidioides brasiliensis Pb18]EEH50597.1 hypothetical protein PADG_06677 [Paracoccidioides brasiliensis Pb18]